ncbi:hypothetical protein K461DRAFT_275445, partial [Myriangium duriaei CBS 260.36]
MEESTQKGSIRPHIPSIEKPCFTCYKVSGDLTAGSRLPLVCLHGELGAGQEHP